MPRAFFVTPKPQIPTWAADGVLLVLWGAAAPTALLASKALQILIWLLPLASLAVIARTGQGLRGPWLRPIHLVMLIPLTALIGAPESVDGLESAARAARLLVEFTALCLLFTTTAALPLALRRRAAMAALVGVGLASVLILLDVAALGAVLTPLWGPEPNFEWRRTAYNRGETFIVMMLPLAGALAIGAMGQQFQARRAAWALAAVGLAAAAVQVGASNSAKVALLVCAGVFLLVYLAPALLRLCLIVMALVTLTLPWIVDAFPPRALIDRSGAALQSIVHRTIIWDFTLARIKERPVLGWGLDASRRMPGGGAEVTVSGFAKGATGERQVVEMTGQVMPLHPHNGVLQIWLELGGLGAVTASGLLALAAIRLPRRRLSRAAKAAVAASLTAGFTVALVSYGLWQGWWLASLFLMASLPALLSSEG